MRFLGTRWFKPAANCKLCHLHPRMEHTVLCTGCFADMPLTGHRPYYSISRCTANESLPDKPNTELNILAACDYAFPVNELIFAFKYEGKLELLPILIDMMLTLPKPHAKTLLVPMPSSSTRLKTRGFDHIHLLTKKLAAQWQLSLWQGVQRIGDAPQQKGLSRAERLDNIQGQFTLTRQPPTGHTLLIIDDVCTTGSTLLALRDCLAPTGLDISAYVLAHKQS